MTAAGIARTAGLESAVAVAAGFDLQTFRRDTRRPGPLFVYVEGDGLAYLDPGTPSRDPTPIDPVGLRMAAADPGPAVLYVGRPCQFAPGRSDPRCDVRAWTTGRYGERIVAAIDEVIGGEVSRSPERPLVLVGYSGGGVVAALVAARRNDVTLVITVAAPLDTTAWTQGLGLSPLDGSKSPLDHADRLSNVRLVALAGQLDKTVPADAIRPAVRRLGDRARLVVVPGFDHRCCWAEEWVRLRDMAWRSSQ